MTDDVREGGCLCGAVRYRLAGELSLVHLCHCRMCQKASGSAFSGYGLAPIAALSFTKGAAKEYRSSGRATRGFCAACGSPITFRYDGKDEIGVALGSLDRPETVALEFHYGVESRLPWLKFDDGLPDVETQTTEAPG